ncbi:amidohydrolase family protein [Stutzerimonas stutzeri]|jgi:cytosine/adenosine deaminase-related metal-dependent hydrolase|uniref:Amidohydrolase family protein n=1 Tax=Stutzerimonas stutzeri TaxID=316 RepID=A0AA42PE96_STUST|nr:amidohydrolase family protein [Stutzerimonas stutzeri]MDH1238807.1 amidohydrolase family protein [Stutzerimonas stutzeri]
MSGYLIQRAEAVMTGKQGPAARAGRMDIRVRGGIIEEMAPELTPLPEEECLDARGCVVYPGWVNTHHHLFQSVIKGVPEGINQPLSKWLGSVPQPRLGRMSPDLLRVAAKIGLAELLLSGASTCADHHYVYAPGIGAEGSAALFEVAEELGIRFVLCRGAATVEPGPGDFPQSMEPETVDGIVRDVEELVARYHQTGPRPLRQVVMAPTTPTFSVHPHELRPLAEAGRALGIRLHTHLSETDDYVHYCRERYDCTPVEFCARHDWLGPDVWFAHMVHATDQELALLAETGTGVSHCPQSNCRLGAGLARAPEMYAAGIPLSLAVDGAAGNEAADMIQEVHMAWLLHRALGGPEATTVDDVVHWATAGGARVLGFEDVGTLAPGMAADIAIYQLDQPRYFGLHDIAVAPVVAAGSASVRHLLVDGKPRVVNGAIPGLDLERLQAQAAEAVGALA